MTNSKPQPLKFANNAQRIVVGGALGLFALLLLPNVFNPGKGGLGLQIGAGLATLVSALLAIRFATGSCIFITEDGVQVREALRRSSYPWREIGGFRSKEARVGAAAYRRSVLVIDFLDGRSITCRALNSKPDFGWVDDAVASLNERLSAAACH